MKTKNSERVFIVINEVIMARSGISFTELLKNTKLPKSSLHMLLKELEDIEILSYNSKTKIYDIGTSFIRLGALCISRVNLLSELNILASSLSDKFNETVHGGVLSGTDVVYILKHESHSKISIVSNIGVTIPAHCTGVGKALLLDKSSDEIRAMYDGVELIKLTERTITNIDDLIAAIERYKVLGYAEERGESSPLAGCIAVPIRNNGSIVASVSLTVPLIKMTDEYISTVSKALFEGAAKLQERIVMVSR